MIQFLNRSLPLINHPVLITKYMKIIQKKLVMQMIKINKNNL